MSKKRKKDKAASLKKNATLKLAREQKKADNQSCSGKIIPDGPSPPVVPADDDVDNVAPPAFIFRFKLGDSVETRPDTQPGVRGYHGESFVGSVAALDYTTRFVTIKSCYNGHMHPAVHENRVYPVSRAINGNDFRFTRAVDANPSLQFQRELDKKDRRISKKRLRLLGCRLLWTTAQKR